MRYCTRLIYGLISKKHLHAFKIVEGNKFLDVLEEKTTYNPKLRKLTISMIEFDSFIMTCLSLDVQFTYEQEFY